MIRLSHTEISIKKKKKKKCIVCIDRKFSNKETRNALLNRDIQECRELIRHILLFCMLIT
jgi:hypothetical protein